MKLFIYCPYCTIKLEQDGSYPHCSKCDAIFYSNAKPCVSVLPVDGSKVLLARRGINPYKGKLDLIGGFLLEDEHPRVGAVREAKEETGLDIKLGDLIGIYHDQYGAGGDFTLGIAYTAHILSGQMKANDDVSALEWHDINQLPKEYAFANTIATLKDLQKLLKNDAKSSEK